MLAVTAVVTVLGLVSAGADERPSPNSATGPRSDQNAGESQAGKSNQNLPPPGQNAGHGRWREIEGTASGKASLSSEQRQKISQFFDRHKAEQVPHVDYSVAVGATVPRQAELKDIPSEVTDILGAYRGDKYVLLQDQLVIVEPKSRRVVAIVPGEARPGATPVGNFGPSSGTPPLCPPLCRRRRPPGGGAPACRPDERSVMNSLGGIRTGRLVTLVLLVILLAVVGRPYFDRLIFTASGPREVTQRGELSEAERATIDIFRRTSPSVVQVVGRANPRDISELEGGDTGVQSGTGFVWDQAGHIVTNNHVVEGVGSVGVRLGSGEVLHAQITGTAPNFDLAVIRIADSGHLPPPIAIGTSADLKVGQFAYAIGNPFGLDESLSTGVISALKRRMPTSAGREIANVIQTDAAINPGNSGGPLLDSAGRVVGVTTAIISPSGSNAGIGFAIPIDVVNRVVPELIRNGRVPTPGIGIIVANEAAATRLSIQGVIVVRTTPGSPAARAGLRGVDPNTGTVGDVIVGVNGTPVRRLADLTDALEQAGVGHEVQIQVERNGKRQEIGVKVADVSPR